MPGTDRDAAPREFSLDTSSIFMLVESLSGEMYGILWGVGASVVAPWLRPWIYAACRESWTCIIVQVPSPV